MTSAAAVRPGFPTPDDALRTYEVLREADYTEKGLKNVLGTKRISPTMPGESAVLLRKASDATPLHVLIRLLGIGVAVDADALREAIHPVPLESWVKASLVRVSGEEVVPLVKLVPYRDLLIASDHLREVYEGGRSDFVAGIGGSTVMLETITLRRKVASTLDLGTGCGVLGLLCCGHSDHVLGTDINSRALEFARLNADLNGIGNLEGVAGDLFEAADGRRFDLIVANPPYVITPSSRFQFRDSGMRGDEFCRAIIRQVPQFLEEGGFCQLLCNCGFGGGATWQETIGEWFEGTGCDALVWGDEPADAAEYAASWIRDSETRDDREFAELYSRWMDYYSREGLEAFCICLVTLRRRSGGDNWLRQEEAPERFTGPGGEDVFTFFETQDFLRSLRDEKGLLMERFRLSPHVRIAQQYQPAEEGLALEQTKMHRVSGAVFSDSLDANVTGLVLRCDGRRRLGEILQEIAAAKQADVEQLTPGGLALVRRLLERGYLERQDSAAD